MYIHEVIIDGFKSYAQKTVVSGFDPQFNAITGLNGTGKSNILDAICFVLGISNLSQVRVGNLQELVYKQGQAGVTKASVTIVFNNSDPATSPVGYESHKQITVTRQVVIGGKNKYILNGHTVQQSQVQNLFHSVQLNVNNPHFLIMQGRITKVLNMKPPETLSMIEEAAGTRMFENKKQASLKTIEKKQLRVDEITKCIEEEITPTLENLRHERQDYHAWQGNNVEFERLDKLCIAWEFKRAEDVLKGSESDRQQLEDRIQELQDQQDQHNVMAHECDQQIALLVQQREQELEGEAKVLKKREADLSKEVVKMSALLNNHQETTAGEQESLESVVRQIAQIESTSESKSRELEQVSGLLATQEQEVAVADGNFVKMREKYQNACAGVADENTADLLSIPEQIVAWEKCQRETSSKTKQCEQRIQHARQQLAEQQRASHSQSASHQALLQEATSLSTRIASRQQELTTLQAKHRGAASISPEQLQAVRVETEALRTQVNSLQASLSARLAFEFKDPERGFDRQRVKGPVAQLFQVMDPQYAMALEVIAGGKLTQIVVDTEHTAKLLLERGQLSKRVTILPLNKLQSRVIPEDKVRQAKAIARKFHGQAYLALELIQFDESIRAAMEYTFGQVILCDQPEIAKAITFDKTLRLNTVTVQGDSYDPKGTLSGGSANQMGTLLQRVYDCQQRSALLQQKTQQLAGLENQWKQCEEAMAAVRDLQTDLEFQQHAYKLCQDKLAGTDESHRMKKLEEIEQELAGLQQELQGYHDLQAKTQRELEGLKSTKKAAGQGREQKLKEFEGAMQTASKQLQALKAKLQTTRCARDTLVAERQALQEEKQALIEQQEGIRVTLSKLTKETKALEQKLDALRETYASAQAAYQQTLLAVQQHNQEMSAIEKNKAQHLQAANQASLDQRKLVHRLKQEEKEQREATQQVRRLVQQHPWIEREASFFGQADTDYDFSRTDMSTARQRWKELKQEQDRLGKKINKKVIGMIETAEAEYEDLTRKRQVILQDKAKIEKVIEELDLQKVQALQRTYQQVNRDFGSIFSMLLPGTSAKLEPASANNLMEGLQVQVAFNSVWKESLTELSGGQRSLLALSLILSLLLFKPAPMYILDEVDAALDLSHTQNIGMMIKTHFASSQFIIVSLKEGMFQNANVIFRTRFVDGISAVTRTVAGGGSVSRTGGGVLKPSVGYGDENAGVGEEDGDDDEGVGPVKKKGKRGAAGRKRADQTALEAF